VPKIIIHPIENWREKNVHRFSPKNMVITSNYSTVQLLEKNSYFCSFFRNIIMVFDYLSLKNTACKVTDYSWQNFYLLEQYTKYSRQENLAKQT
jgi:hypothetical protein